MGIVCRISRPYHTSLLLENEIHVSDSIRWTVQDRYGNKIYLTEERWLHIIEPINHPEMAYYEEHLQDTIQFGHRKQDTLNSQKYRYSKDFADLAEYNTHIVAIVLCRFREGPDGTSLPNNYIVTAYQKEIW